MTRKHFNELAEILRDLRPKRSKIEKALWDEVVVQIATMCSNHNDRFDRERFYEACERSL